MIGVGTSLLFDRRAGKGGSPIPPFNDAMVDAWFMSGLSNNDKPTQIVGVKKNKLQLKNFAYALNSGFGEYAVDFNLWGKSSFITDISSEKVTAKFYKGATPGRRYILEHSKTETVESFNIRYTSNGNRPLEYNYIDADGSQKRVVIPSGTVYTLPKSYTSESAIHLGFSYVEYGDEDIIITITQLPTAYEGALVFDGVDDYGICYNLPILTDYTVICRREIINQEKDFYSIASKSKVFGKGAFIFEPIQSRSTHCYSFSADNKINLYNSEISWQTKNSYNGSTITVGNADDTDTLTLGTIRERDSRRLKGAIYYFALYNKSLTPEEIETEKERLNEEWLKRKTE